MFIASSGPLNMNIHIFVKKCLQSYLTSLDLYDNINEVISTSEQALALSPSRDSQELTDQDISISKMKIR